MRWRNKKAQELFDWYRDFGYSFIAYGDIKQIGLEFHPSRAVLNFEAWLMHRGEFNVKKGSILRRMLSWASSS